MLGEHLSQEHDAASRRADKVDAQVGWIHRTLSRRPTRVLDIGCGPGLYTSRLARLGHSCVGIDFGPASVEYAKKQAESEGLDCEYRLGDVRSEEFGEGFGLAMMLYGEFNVFRPEEAREIMLKAHAALAPGGTLLVEAHTYEIVRRLGHETRSWSSAESGLFSVGPHLCLTENIWCEQDQVAIQRYYILDAETGAVERHSASVQAYSDDQYCELLTGCGFEPVALPEPWPGVDHGDLQPMLGRARPERLVTSRPC